MSFNTAIKTMIPAAFFGYAAFANYTLLTGDVERPDLSGFMKGAFSQEVDGIYRANLPHRNVAVSWVGAVRYALLSEGRSGVVAGEDGWLFSSEEFRSMGQDAPPLHETMAWIAYVDATLEAYGSDLVLLPLPAKLDIARDQIRAGQAVDQISQTYSAFLEELAAYGVDYIDTRPSLEAQGRAFYATDTHWTPDGATAVAGAVARSGVIALGDTGFTRKQAATEGFAGDLVTFVTSDTLAPMVGLPLEEATPYLAELTAEDAGAGPLDLFGTESPVPIVLVGTSYSADPRWSFAEALKLSLRHDVINHATEGQGPITPMRAFMDGIDPTNVPPVVVWEFPVRYLSDPDLMEAVHLPEDGGNA